MTTSVLSTNKTTSNSLVSKYPILIFVLFVYAMTWPFFILEVLASYDMLSFELPMPIMILQAFMPGLAAVIVTGMISGKAGIRSLLGKLLIARVGFRWYIFAVFAFAGISFTTIWINNLFGPSPALPFLSTRMPPFSGTVEMLLVILSQLIFSVIFNSEEIGWRGFALPRLQAKYSALTSSLILSIPWLLFHFPLFFKQGSSQADSSFISFGIGMVATTVIFTWLYNNTSGSVLLAALLHASTNTWTQVFSINSAGSNQFLGWTMTGLSVLVAVVILAISGAENLSRTNTRIQE